jgi:cytochrome P450
VGGFARRWLAMPERLGTSLNDELDRLLRGDQAVLADPFPLWTRLREEAPIHDYASMTFVSRHRDVQAVLQANDRLSRSSFDDGTQAAAFRRSLPASASDAFDEITGFERDWLVRSRGEQHLRLRRIAHRAFTPRRIAEQRAALDRVVTQLLDDLAASEAATGGTSDLVAGLGDRLPMVAISHMFDAPLEDGELLYRWIEPLKIHIATRGERASDADIALIMEAREGMNELRSYVKRLAASHREAGASTTLIEMLLDAQQDERLDEEGLAALMVNFLFAGRDTTRGLIINGLLALLRNPEQWRLLCSDASLIGAAVEESMRFVSPAQGVPAVAVDDIELDGATIEAGRTVYLVVAAANRDPEVFQDPETLDIARPDAKHHLGFGFGPHFCLGSSLARLEAQLVYSALRTRFPEMRLGGDELTWAGPFKLRHPQTLPVRLGPDHASVD